MPLIPVSTGDPHVAAHNEEREAINALEEEFPTKLDKPPVPRVGDLLRFDGIAWTTSQTRLFEGDGQPEGVVAAPIGSRYVDVTAAEGAVEWLKIRGVDDNDNTGWQLLLADTGLRNISSLIDTRSTAVVNAAYLRRSGDLVDIYLDLKMPTNIASPWSLMTLPVGFRPPFTRHGALQDNNEAAAATSAVLNTGVVNLYTLVSAKTDRWNGSWLTRDPWPAALPGTAVA